MKHDQIKKICILAMLTALAYALVCVVRVPVFGFLSYEPKDVIIALGGFLYGPLAALAISAIVALLEMVTISTTGWIGMLMNLLGSAAFACSAAYVYQKRRTLGGAVAGLGIGCVLMTVSMLLFNFLITPLYMGVPRADVAAMLVPVFLPFNLLKSGLNAALTVLLYRPLVQGLRLANLFPRGQGTPAGRRGRLAVFLGAGAVLFGCIVGFLFAKGVF